MNVRPEWLPLEGLGRHPAIEALAIGGPDGEAIAAFLTEQPFPLAEPGMLDKVISVGSAAPRYSAPAPARAELLAALGG